MKVSNCCGYEIGDPYYLDIGLCPACKEHCDFEEVNEEEEEETQKTALMELIDWIKCDTLPLPIPETLILAKATELLQKERQQIIDAYDAGEFDQFDGETRMHAGKNDYYNKTFNQ